MNLWANKLLNFVAQMGLYLFCVMAFYLSTGNCYFIDGKIVDFSLLGWALMLAIWGCGLVFYFRRKNVKILIFATQLSVICFAFDCWRLFAFAANLSAKSYINILLVAEFIAILIAWCIKNNFLLSSALISLLLIYTGCVTAYPALLSWNQILAVSAVWAFMASLQFSYWLKPKFMFLFIGVLLSGWGCYLYYQTNGIHFYEAKITKPAQNVKVSIIVPVYNAEKTLKRSLDSLRKQTLKDIEIICVNDGSIDKSGQILADYAAHDARFKVITQENKYIGAARNTGLAAATGEYVGFLDNDDWVSPDYYENLYRRAKFHDADIAVVAQNYEIFNRVGNKFNKNSQIMFLLNTDVIDNLKTEFFKIPRFVWDKIYRKSFLDKYYIKSSERRTFYEDFFFILQAEINANKIAVAHEGKHYWNRLGKTTSRVSNVPFSEEPALLYLDIFKYIQNAALSPEDKEDWRKLTLIHMEIVFIDIYLSLREEDKDKWVDYCQKLFPDVSFTFSEEKFNELMLKYIVFR